MNSTLTDPSGIYVGWNRAFPSNLLQGQCQGRQLEDENQSPGEAGTAVRRNTDYTPNQCKMLTGLRGRKTWQPNCISWALPVSRCYYSYMQINKHWAEIKRERDTEDDKRKKISAQIRVASIIINIKTEILPHSGSQVLCFKEKKKKGKPQISLSQKSCLNFVLSLNSCSFKFWRSPFNLCLDQSHYAVGASTKNLIPTLNLVHHYPQQCHYLF